MPIIINDNNTLAKMLFIKLVPRWTTEAKIIITFLAVIDNALERIFNEEKVNEHI
jgi:hypothetical protein